MIKDGCKYSCDAGACVKCVKRETDPDHPDRDLVTLSTYDCKQSAISWICCTGACSDPGTCTQNSRGPPTDTAPFSDTSCKVVSGCTPEAGR